jgi:hypothetical protein
MPISKQIPRADCHTFLARLNDPSFFIFTDGAVAFKPPDIFHNRAVIVLIYLKNGERKCQC